MRYQTYCFIFISGLFSGLISCTEEAPFVMEEEVASVLIPHFQSFALEAEKYDVYIDWSVERISASLGTVTDDGASGQCLKYTNGRHEIRIDKNYWDRINANEKEFVIYHELGHCLLNRGHLDDMDDNGLCISIMTSGEFECQKRYNQNTRNRYLEELFLYQN